VPGDKSIAHRALLLAAMAAGESTIENLPEGADVAATAACVSALGASIERQDGSVRVRSSGALLAPPGPLDARNSGTTMRLLAGVLAGQDFDSTLVGDDSLSRRPMGRVIEPLERMGAEIVSHGGLPPLDVRGRALRGITYPLPIDSAQVKSAILLAGLFARGETAVVERVPTRDHTERMLCATGVDVRAADGQVFLRGDVRPHAFHLEIPGDQSSAAFLLAAAVLTGGSVRVVDVGINPTRMGFVRALQRMGASISVALGREDMGEPAGSVTVSGPLSTPIEIGPEEVPALVDELPLLALLATQVDGRTSVRGAQELRVKETDRITTVVETLRALGAEIEEHPDGFAVTGASRLRGSTVRSHGDHRLAMMQAVAGLIAEGETIVENAEAAEVSFPQFAATLGALGGAIDAG
jgi:3-phosphoshikimate 1-carboxyvinyltransferase